MAIYKARYMTFILPEYLLYRNIFIFCLDIKLYKHKSELFDLLAV